VLLSLFPIGTCNSIKENRERLPYMNSKGTILIGFSLGLFLPVFSLVAIAWLRPELSEIQKFDYEMIKDLNVGLMTVGMLLNALVFFIGLRLNKESFSKGVMAASLLVLILIFIYKFLL
jgi:uncharacterized membrane protein YozB (DUF420 family)